MLGLHVFGVDDHIESTFVTRDAGVVEMRGEIETGLAKRQFGVVEVDNVRMVTCLPDPGSAEPLFHKRGIHGRRVFVPHPIVFGVPIVHAFRLVIPSGISRLTPV